MRSIWLLVLLAIAALPGGERDRAALLAADRELARSTDFLSAFADDAAYLYPGARLVRGKNAIRALLDSAGAGDVTWTPEYADVSDDGTLGYTYGWTRSGGGDQQGKYLACWRHRDGGSWMVTAYTRTRFAPGTTPTPAGPGGGVPARAVRGPGDSRQLKSADSAFAALSVARGAQAAFLPFAASEATLLGPPGAPMTHGHEAIGTAFVTADIAGSGDLGCTVGEASITARNSYSKYLTIWKRQPGGAWKFVADGGNARPAP